MKFGITVKLKARIASIQRKREDMIIVRIVIPESTGDTYHTLMLFSPASEYVEQVAEVGDVILATTNYYHKDDKVYFQVSRIQLIEIIPKLAHNLIAERYQTSNQIGYKSHDN